MFMNAKRGLFAFPAFFSSLVSFFVVCCVIYGSRQMSPTTSTNVDQWSDVLSVAALTPAVVATYLALNEEHEQVSIALGLRRLLLVMGIVASLFYTLTAAVLHNPRSVVWFDNISIAVGFFEWSIAVFFLSEIMRIETWRHSFSKRHRKELLIILAIGAVIMLIAGMWILVDIHYEVPHVLSLPWRCILGSIGMAAIIVMVLEILRKVQKCDAEQL
ncbi:hypothetical protein [Actinomyces israelii]|uniref:hypothetical protein n=1 Tax=Actinomyces israelii TaxID=1659 RepID=UPI0012EB0F18|nr:hypothetical protein [Actinomyces israelii]